MLLENFTCMTKCNVVSLKRTNQSGESNPGLPDDDTSTIMSNLTKTLKASTHIQFYDFIIYCIGVYHRFIKISCQQCTVWSSYSRLKSTNWMHVEAFCRICYATNGYPPASLTLISIYIYLSNVASCELASS